MQWRYKMLTVLTGDVLEQLRTLPDESVQCCVTSPPYWGLRDYGTAAWEGGDDSCDHIEMEIGMSDKNTLSPNHYLPQTNAANVGRKRQFAQDCGKCGAKRIDSQLGLEKTPEEYVAKMVAVFREVRRVLRKDGTLWMNLGDTYNQNTGKGFNGNAKRPECARETKMTQPFGLPSKNLIGIPWRVAFALQADGWWLRSDIIWAKPNPMPESVTDRPTKAHEYLFLLTKSANYFYDAEAIKEANAPATIERAKYNWCAPETKAAQYQGMNGLNRDEPYPLSESGRNKRSVWTVATAPYPEAHFATYPPDLIKPCIMAGTSAKGCCANCGAPWERQVEVSYSNWADGNNNGRRKGEIPPERMTFASGKRCEKSTETLGWQPTCKCDAGGVPCTVLDPFAGSGTTGMVALELGRKAVLIELNPKYCELIRQRCDVTLGLQLA